MRKCGDTGSGAPDWVHRIGNPGYNDTKSAFADCTLGIRGVGGHCGSPWFGNSDARPVARWVAWESAKADFVLL